MADTQASYAELVKLKREQATLGSVSALVGWDQETYMPAGGADFRAEQSAVLAKLVHERATSPRVGELLDACAQDRALGDASTPTGASLREMRRDYDLATKLPGDLVAELAQTGSLAQEAWKHAREGNDFQAFRPWLEKMVELARRKAQCYGTPEGGEAYDALLNEYEPDARASEIAGVFEPLRERLSAFIAEVRDNGTPPDTKVLGTKISEGAQHAFGIRVLDAIGFDLNAGRLDTTTHPFCSGMAPGDTRLTTRYREQHFSDALYSTMHEGGHGLYEQGLPKGGELFGTPLAESVSLGIHESQSRLWENFVGRSSQFWTWAMPIAKDLFGGALGGVSVEHMTAAVNTATPSLIRVESDEATYNLHVMLRFTLERAMMRGELEVADLPGEWNRLMQEMLGVEVPDDARGCLQDVHWSFGLMGYFPTYALGNLYAAQIWETIRERIPTLDAQIERGSFGELLGFLREHIHAHGRRYSAGELCERITGKPLEAEPLMRHLASRVKPAYGMA